MPTAKWEHLTASIKRPDGIAKPEEYRDRLRSVYTDDGKLHFFGLKGVDPTSQNWHETLLQGSYVSRFDVGSRKFQEPPGAFGPLDRDPDHREHLFAVRGQLFVFVYSVHGRYYKLFQWKDADWSAEVKIESDCGKVAATAGATACGKVDEPSRENLDYKFFATQDGFYVTWESGDGAFVARLTVDLDPSSGRATGARCACVARANLREHFPVGGHVTALAFGGPDHSRLYVWGGQMGCGFRWTPAKVLTAQLETGKMVELKKLETIADPTPPYCFSGPHDIVQLGTLMIMLGGSTQVGIDQCEDNKEIWAFDLAAGRFRKLAAQMPPEVVSHRVSIGVDYSKGDIYVCDFEKGIFSINSKNL